MRKFGEFVHSLSGRYITAEDGNGNRRHGCEMLPLCYWNFRGKRWSWKPITNMVVWCMGMKAAAKQQFGSDVLSGKYWYKE
jgi:leucine dehydrogenase